MKNLLPLLLLSIAIGCELPEDDALPPSGNEGSGDLEDLNPCVQSTVVVASDDATAGYSADDILAFAVGAFDTDMLWFVDDTTVPFELEVTYSGGTIELIDREPAPDAGEEVYCQDSLSIEVELHFSTSDGAFNETLDLRLKADRASTATFDANLAEDSWDGSYVFEQADTSEFDDFYFGLWGSIADDGNIRGGVSAQSFVEFDGASLVNSYSISSWPVNDDL